MLKKRNNIFYFVICILISLIIGILIGYLNSQNFLFLFNKDGKLDMETLWTAIGAIATALLGLIAFIQNYNANEMNKRLTEKSLIGSSYSLLEPISMQVTQLNENDILHNTLAVFTNLVKNDIKTGKWLDITLTFNSLTVIKPTYYIFKNIYILTDDKMTYAFRCQKNNKVKFGQKGNRLVCKFYIQLAPDVSTKVLNQAFEKKHLSILIDMSYVNLFNVMAKGKYDITFDKESNNKNTHTAKNAIYSVYLSNFRDSSFELPKD